MTTKFFIYNSPCGLYRVESRGGAIIRMQIVSDAVLCEGEGDEFEREVSTQLTEYYRGERTAFSLSIDYSDCTSFQQRVYSELLKIPYGKTRTYKEIATAIGNPNASRAVGLACNRNPIHIIIPCHRVVGSNGKMVGYAAGVAVKNSLLNLER